MKIIAINGSPRKGWNTDIVLDHAIRGALSENAQVEEFHLFDLSFSGCQSCFRCKAIGGGSIARCGWRDELTEVLSKTLDADGLLIAAPVYFRDVPGAVRNFYERVLFPSQIYAADGHKGYVKDVNVGLIYTMNVEDPKQNGYLAEEHATFFKRLMGPAEVLNIVDTCQFHDYSAYLSERFDASAKMLHKEQRFADDCARAYEFGKNMARGRRESI